MNTPKAPLWVSLSGLVIMSVFTGLQDVLTDRVITSQEWIQVAIQLVMVLNVYLAANLPGYERAKFYVAAVIAGLQALYTLVPGGVDLTEGINLVITILAALGVTLVPRPMTRTIDGETRVYKASDGPPRTVTTR
jgi:hypothetical protein